MFRSALATLRGRSGPSFSTLALLPQRSHCLHRIPKPPLSRLSRSLHTTSKSRCPECSAPLPTPLPVCPACSYISAVPVSTPYFEVFDVSPSPNLFEIDVLELKKRFLQLQRLIHPDSWSVKGAQKQEIASQLSTLVNDAYTQLSDPLRRVEYILKQNGISSEGEDTLEDPTVLMSVLEYREALEEASDQEEVDDIQMENREQINETLEEIRLAVGNQNWPVVRSLAIRLKYLYGIEAAAKSWPERVHDH